jgi:hypothetical protein
MKTRIQKIYHDYGFGFPVTLLNVPMVEARGELVPNVNQNYLQGRVIEALVLKENRLTGNEVHFIRLFCQMTLVHFADRFDVSHPAVIKWEKTGNHATSMNWTTEKDIRLFALAKLRPKDRAFVMAYDQLAAVAIAGNQPICIDCQKRSA